MPISSRTQFKRSFYPLPLGTVRPRGWLEKQLRIQAEGLSGNLEEVWPEGALISINDETPFPVEQGTFHTITREWKKKEKVILDLPMKIRLSRRYNNSVSVHRGALTFSLSIGAEWKQIRGKAPAAYYEVYPTSKWNYALVIDTDHPEKSFSVDEKSVKMPCFSEKNAPVVITAKARELPDWGMKGASAAPPPQSPVTSSNPEEKVELIPYGSAKLKITEFPVVI
ncbi:MAG TPA: hypothetical protein ENH82_09405 [bacterium]|nr:hypothetical protein [bacterium]